MPEVDQLELKARIGKILNRWPAVGLAVGVVRNGRLEFFHGHGLADIASNTPVAEDTVFRIGSITKTFTTIAVMQLWEQELIDLDAPANDYLRGYRLIPRKDDPSPRHFATFIDAHRRTARGGVPLTDAPAGLRRDGEARKAGAVPCRVLPRRPPSRG
jgi:CubicO group peptidase (beta-lactamase class C family)